MKRKLWVSFSMFMFVFITITSSGAASNASLEERIKALEKDSDNAAGRDAQEQDALSLISDKIRMSGAIELDYSYAEDSNVSDNADNDSASELEIGTVELGIEVALHENVTANVLLKGESLDSDDDRIFWDEVFFAFRKPGLPYFVGGKRCQPFGVYESLFINDPITQDLYEINESGATIGYANDEWWGLDLSLTVYKGETLITRVNDADYGWSRDTASGYAETNDVSSFIINTTVSPVEQLSLSVYLNSEPGDSDRNTTIGGAIHWEYSGMIADAEYIGALGREKHIADNQEYKERAWAVSFGYQIADPLLLAIRYEGFDSDKNQDGNLDNRYGLAATYTFFENESVVCNLMGEYRRSEYEASSGAVNDSEADEFFARVAVEF